MAATRVLVLGGGFTALHFCRSARRAIKSGQLDVTVVARDNFLCIHGMINEMVVGRIAPGTIANPARRIFAPAKFHQGEIESIDVEGKKVVTSRAIDGARSELEYDVLVLGLGTAENLEVYPGLAEHAFKLKSFHDCFRLRNHILEMLELAEDEPDEEERRRLLTFFVAGGGYSGTEIAGELADFLTRMTAKEYPRIDRNECRVVVVHPGPSLLPELYGSGGVERKSRAHPRLIKHAEKHARSLGVELFLETRVKSATPSEVYLSNDEAIPTRTIISSVGTRPNPLIEALGFERDEHGRLVTDEYLRVKGQSDVWAGGDNGASRHPKGGTVPPVAFYALKTGRHIGKQVARQAAGKALKPYRSQVRIQGINLGGRRAVGEVSGFGLYGYMPWVTFRIGALYLAASLDRRLHLLADWTVAMLAGRDIVQMRGHGGPGYEVVENFFEPGQHIADRHRLFRYVHVVVEGEVDLLKRVDGREEAVSTVTAGGYFGRKVLDRAGADLVRAKSVVRTLAIHVDQANKLQDVLRGAPTLVTRTGVFAVPDDLTDETPS
ncbi:MAG: FAD-dependent oxidoreductase [Gaiellaceae bacterium]